MKLYEIDEALEELLEALDYAEDTDEVQADIDSMIMEREQKIEGVALFIKSLKADALAIKAEEKALADRRKVVENKQKSLENWLQYAVDGKKFSTSKCAISFRKSESVQINGENVPEGYIVRKVVESYDKASIKKALKEGIEVEACELITKQNMQVK